MADDDDFIKAVMMALSPHLAPDQETLEEAIQYCEEIKNSEDGWQVCMEKLHEYASNDGPAQMTFFCLEVVRHTVETRYQALDEEQRSMLRQSLMVFMRDVCSAHSQSHMIRTKLGVLLVGMVKEDYPQQWPSFFSDLISILEQGEELIKIFFCVLKALDQEVVDNNNSVSSAEQKRNMYIKDAMREDCIPELVATLQNIMVSFEETNSDITKGALETLGDYINWIDRDLVANDDMVGLFYRYLGDENLQMAACDCLKEIVYKRMGSVVKLNLMQHLDIASVLSQGAEQLDSYSEEFAIKLASLASLVGSKCVKVLKEPTSAEGSVDEKQAWDLLVGAFTTITAYLEHPHYRVSEICIPFFLEYVNLLKKLPDGCQPVHFEHIRIMIDMLVVKMAYPDWYNHDDPDDEEAHFEEFRSICIKLYKNIAHCEPEAVVEQLSEIFQTMFNDEHASLLQLESLMKLFYIVGQVLRQTPINKLVTVEPIPTMLSTLIQSNVRFSDNFQIKQVYFDILNRYSSFLDLNPDYLETVFEALMNEHGIKSQNKSIRSSASYCLHRIVKSMPSEVRYRLEPVSKQLLEDIQSLIEPFLLRPLWGHNNPNNNGAGRSLFSESAKLDMANGENFDNLITVDDAYFLAEVMGILVTSHVQGDEFPGFFENAMSFFLQHIDSKNWQSDVNNDLVGNRYAQIIACLSHVTKPVPNREDGARIAEVMIASLEHILQIFLEIPAHAELRHATIFYFHRIIECLHADALGYLQSALEPLISMSTPTNLVPVLQLVNQIIKLFTADFVDYLDSMFTPLLEKTIESYNSYNFIEEAAAGGDAVYSAEKSERADLIKAYLLHLRTIIVNNCIQVYTSDNNSGSIGKVLTFILEGCSSADPTVCKTAFQVFGLLAEGWSPQIQSGELDQNIMEFLCQEVIQSSFECFLMEHCVIADGGWNNALREVARFHVLGAKFIGPDWLQALGEFMASNFELGPDDAEQYCALASDGRNDELKPALQMIINQARQI